MCAGRGSLEQLRECEAERTRKHLVVSAGGAILWIPRAHADLAVGACGTDAATRMADPERPGMPAWCATRCAIAGCMDTGSCFNRTSCRRSRVHGTVAWHY